jgi:UDP-glucuronate decarboxylase
MTVPVEGLPATSQETRMTTGLVSLEQLLTEDLNRLVNDLDDEFSRMAGSRLLVTGGAGFLGYYLVLGALHWNRLRPKSTIDVTVWDNFMRGQPDWLAELAATPHLRVEKRDLCLPLPANMGHFDWIIHAAGIASPIFYRAQPLKCIDANINGLRNLLDYCVAQRDAGTPCPGDALLLVERDLRRPER